MVIEPQTQKICRYIIQPRKVGKLNHSTRIPSSFKRDIHLLAGLASQFQESQPRKTFSAFAVGLGRYKCRACASQLMLRKHWLQK